jgi:hypothetical protein
MCPEACGSKESHEKSKEFFHDCMFFIVIIRIEQFCGAKLRFLFELCKKMPKNRPERRFFGVRWKGEQHAAV